jgi:hypothetical protein
MIDELRPSHTRGFLYPALWLAGPVLVVALLLLPFALPRSGSGGPGGLAVASAVCLSAGWSAEATALALKGRVAPLTVMLLGMAIRLAPPMALCLVLVAARQGGQQHLAFIVYLLIFYVVTLAVETCLSVKRLGHTTSNMNHGAG